MVSFPYSAIPGLHSAQGQERIRMWRAIIRRGLHRIAVFRPVVGDPGGAPDITPTRSQSRKSQPGGHTDKRQDANRMVQLSAERPRSG